MLRRFVAGARGGTRTLTLFPALAPEASASTNSATLAQGVIKAGAHLDFGVEPVKRELINS